jgi:hypothetical protein
MNKTCTISSPMELVVVNAHKYFNIAQVDNKCSMMMMMMMILELKEIISFYLLDS